MYFSPTRGEIISMLASILLFAASDPTVVVKLGGSAVTRKDRFETLNRRVLASTAQQLRATRGSAVLVHGCGSFGHFQAHEFGIAKGTAHPTFSWLGFAKARDRYIVGQTEINNFTLAQ